jgi:hypothetical protein
MATTTPNYGWPVPTSTDYVKDGATAIEALGDAIDATVFGLGSGLKLINAQTLTASSGVSFTNVLDSTYNFYKVVISGYNSARGNNFNMRARINVTDVTAGYYSASWYASYNATTGFGASNPNVAYWTLFTNAGQSTDTGTSINTIDMRVSSDNRLIFGGTGYDGYYGGAMFNGGTLAAQANAPTGFTIYPSGGTFTGTIALYGYQKA